MIEIDLNATFDARVATARRKLARVVTNTESSIAAKVRSTPQVTKEDIKTCEEIVRNFLGVYESLSDELERREIFHREKENSYFELINMYSLYAASKAVLNKLNDESVERIRSYEAAPPQVNLTYSDVNQKSEYNSLEKILNDLSSISKKNNAAALKYAYFTFFDKIRDLAKSYIATYGNVDTLNELNQLQIFKTGLDFHEIPPPKKKEFQNEKAVADTSFKEGLPSELSPYHLVNPPTLDTVVGNERAIEILHAALIRLLKYDSQKKQNPFRKFNDAFIVYGDPGVGKNFTVDALLNHIQQTKDQYGEVVEFVNLASGLKSSYVNRSAAIFERYIAMENEGDKVYINIIDEADAIFPVNAKGEMHEETKKLLGEMKRAINNAALGNSLFILMTNYAEQFESALKQRFTMVKMDGPRTPEEFGQQFMLELGGIQGLGQEDFLQLGAKIAKYKEMYAPPAEESSLQLSYVPVTGRDVKKIAAPFVSGSDSVIIANEDTIRRASYDQMLKIMPQLQRDVSFDALCHAIDEHIESLSASSEQTTARYNK